MRESLLEVGLEAVSLLLYTIVGAVLAGLGTLFEYRSYLFMSSGEQFLAVWIAAMGILLLALAYLVVRDKAWDEYVELRAR